MATQVRIPPKEHEGFRGAETFMKDLHDQHRRVGEAIIDLGSIAASAKATIQIPVNGAKADTGQCACYALPSTWNTALRVISCFVSADDVVSIVIENGSGGAIDPPSATYYAWVKP